MNSKLAPTVVIPWILSLGTILIGIWQFADKSAQANREPFLQKQLELCFEASRAVAQLANGRDVGEWETARKTFLQLFWGPLKMVENQKVASAMGKVKVKLDSLVPADKPVKMEQLPLTVLDAESRELACAARNLILESWRVSLPPIEDLCS